MWDLIHASFFFSADISRLVFADFNGVNNFSTFLLDRVSGMIYLGARDAVIAVDTANLSKKKMVSSHFFLQWILQIVLKVCLYYLCSNTLWLHLLTELML